MLLEVGKREKTIKRLINAKTLGISTKTIAKIAGVDYSKVYWFMRCDGVRTITNKEIARVAAALDEIKDCL